MFWPGPRIFRPWSRHFRPRSATEKRAMLEEASKLLKDQQANPQRRLTIIADIAEQWMEIGERERARAMLLEGKSIVDAIKPPPAVYEWILLPKLARLEPDQVVERLKKSAGQQAPAPGTHTAYDFPAAVAVELATEHPAEAEQVFQLWERSGIQPWTNGYAMRIARRLAKVDPPRARRFAASQRGPAERSLAWAFVALGLTEKDKSGAAAAIDPRSPRSIA